MKKSELRKVILDEINFMTKIKNKNRNKNFKKILNKKNIKLGDRVTVNLDRDLEIEDNVYKILDGLVFISKFPNKPISPEDVERV